MVAPEPAEKYKAHLPQTFHGLPTFSSESGTTDQLYPPISLFFEPPLGGTEMLDMETLSQTATQIQHTTDNIQQPLAELKARLREKATDQEHRLPNNFQPQ